jgi:hypothetical protein
MRCQSIILLLTLIDMVCVTRAAGVSWNVPVSALLKDANFMRGSWTIGYRSCMNYLSCLMHNKSRSFCLLRYVFTYTPLKYESLTSNDATHGPLLATKGTVPKCECKV